VKNKPFDEEEWALLHYATGLLIGLAHKHGVVDVVIYHDDVHIQITTGVSKDGKVKQGADG
jgi:hypothetical protein